MAIAVAALVPAAGAAPGEPAAVLVVPASSPVFRSPRAAHGLLVAGEGATVSRRNALASLLRGKMGNAIVSGGLPGGKPLITLSRRPARYTFYVVLPPRGRHHNVVRYPIAVTGPGYRGLLTDSSTRLPGLVSIADVARSARALARGDRPRIRSQPESDALGRLARLDHRLDQAHDARVAATAVLAGLVILLALLALATRFAALARATFLAPSALIAAAVALSAAGVASPGEAVVGVALAGAVGSLVAGALLPPRLPLTLALAALFAFLFTVMWTRPEWNALAVIGPHPDGGGRFYGVTNEVETLLLAPALVLGALVGTLALPVVALVIAAGISASRVGADGGGLVVYLVGFLVLWLRLRRVPALRAAAATAVAAGAALLLIGIDAATGGSSHVTDAVGGGPGSLLGDLGHRLHLSAAAIGSTWNAALLFALGVAALVILALQRPRYAVLDAYLAAIVVSLIVNDTPADVAGYGGLAALGLWLLARSERDRRTASVDSPAMRRVAPFLALAFLLAGCGGSEVVSPTAETVVGTNPTPTTATTGTTQAVKGDAKAGAALFTSQGCGGCHKFQPAGTSGMIGPDLDKLPEYAKNANQGSLADFTHESIANPTAYVEKGYSPSMPNFGDTLSDKQIADLVAYLTQNTG